MVPPTSLAPYRPTHASCLTKLLNLQIVGDSLALVSSARTVLHAEDGLHLVFDLRHQNWVVLEEELRILAALTDALPAIAVPRAGLLDDPVFGADVHQGRSMADPRGVR